MLLARADSGKETLEYGPADACAVVRGAIEQGEKLARSHGIEFKASIPSGSISIQADSEALRRAVLILIDNAVKYTPTGGVVKVDLAAEGGFAVVSVTDTGIGIAKEDIAHVFDRFWRADKVRSRGQGGAGLGLSIATWIAEAHQGALAVESAPGRGSVFSLRVPLYFTAAVGVHASRE